MGFMGADTEALRAHARSCETAATAMAASHERLMAAIAAVDWRGPDADAMRERWHAVAGQWSARTTTLRAHGTDLLAQADEQDEASGVEGGAGFGALAGRSIAGGALGAAAAPAAPDPQGMFRGFFDGEGAGEGREGGGAADIRSAAFMAHPSGPGGPRLAMASAPSMRPLDPGAEDADDEDSVADADNFEKQRGGKGTTAESLEADTDRGSASITKEGHKTTYSSTLKHSVTWETPGSEKKGGPIQASGSFTHEVAATYEHSDNGDGTRTYRFSEAVTDTAKAEASVKTRRVDLFGSAEAGAFQKVTKEVTVPAGVTAEQAARMSADDPASIPNGAKLTYTTDEGTKFGGSAGAGAGGVKLIDFQGAQTNTDRHAATYARDENGALSIKTGDAAIVESKSGAQLGPDSVNVNWASNQTVSHGKAHFAEFTPGAEGDKAFAEAVTNGKLPGKDAPGVADQYTETRSSTTVDHIRAFKLGPISEKSTGNARADEFIIRERPDGTNEWARQVLPDGDRSKTYVVERGGTGRESSYEVMLGDDSPANRAKIKEIWGMDSKEGHVRLRFDKSAAEELMRSGNTRRPPTQNPTDYFASLGGVHKGNGVSSLDQDASGHWKGTPNQVYELPRDRDAKPIPGELLEVR